MVFVTHPLHFQPTLFMKTPFILNSITHPFTMVQVFFARKSARFYAFRYKSTPSTALPSMLVRTKICKHTRSDYRLFPLWFTVPLVFQFKLKPYTAYMALCSVFLAYLFLKFDHNNQENIVAKFWPRTKASRASAPSLFTKPAGRPAIAKVGSFPVQALFTNFDMQI